MNRSEAIIAGLAAVATVTALLWAMAGSESELAAQRTRTAPTECKSWDDPSGIIPHRDRALSDAPNPSSPPSRSADVQPDSTSSPRQARTIHLHSSTPILGPEAHWRQVDSSSLELQVAHARFTMGVASETSGATSWSGHSVAHLAASDETPALAAFVALVPYEGARVLPGRLAFAYFDEPTLSAEGDPGDAHLHGLVEGSSCQLCFPSELACAWVELSFEHQNSGRWDCARAARWPSVSTARELKRPHPRCHQPQLPFYPLRLRAQLDRNARLLLENVPPGLLLENLVRVASSDGSIQDSCFADSSHQSPWDLGATALSISQRTSIGAFRRCSRLLPVVDVLSDQEIRRSWHVEAMSPGTDSSQCLARASFEASSRTWQWTVFEPLEAHLDVECTLVLSGTGIERETRAHRLRRQVRVTFQPTKAADPWTILVALEVGDHLPLPLKYRYGTGPMEPARHGRALSDGKGAVRIPGIASLSTNHLGVETFLTVDLDRTRLQELLGEAWASRMTQPSPIRALFCRPVAPRADSEASTRIDESNRVFEHRMPAVIQIRDSDGEHALSTWLDQNQLRDSYLAAVKKALPCP